MMKRSKISNHRYANNFTFVSDSIISIEHYPFGILVNL